MKRISLITQSVFYLVAGINHFRDPGFYLELIPPYLPFPSEINLLAGVIEVLLAFGLWFTKTRKWSSWAILLMLLAFVPSHVYFIQIGSCIEGGLCVPEWVGWARLLVIHPLLMIWAWFASKNEKPIF